MRPKHVLRGTHIGGGSALAPWPALIGYDLYDMATGSRERFEQRFGFPPTAAVRVPGRVNLLGDHTDYHDGFVLPMAIERAILLQGRPRDDGLIRIFSHTLKRTLELDLSLEERHAETWAHYFQGVLSVLGEPYKISSGCDVLIDGDLPPGGGLSSSSALVVGFGALLAQLYALDLDALQLAILGRDAEHWYGTTGGIMDQFVISHARAGHAVLLDCRSLKCSYVPLPDGVTVVIANTGTRHDQIASPFADRRKEAEAGLRLLQSRLPEVKALRDIEPDVLEAHAGALLAADQSGVLWRRCRHVVTENARVVAAASALAAGDLRKVAVLMAASHASLRDDYQVSCPELDAMVAAVEDSPGCFGARMTGGGFGGCTVNLVSSEVVDSFCRSLAERYHRATGIEPTIFTTRPADGVQALESALSHPGKARAYGQN